MKSREQAAIMAAKIAGCTTVIAVDLHDNRLELARELGATHTINSATTDMGEELNRITGGEGVDSIVDTTSVPAVLNQAARALATRSSLTGFSLASRNVTFIGLRLSRCAVGRQNPVRSSSA